MESRGAMTLCNSLSHLTGAGLLPGGLAASNPTPCLSTCCKCCIRAASRIWSRSNGAGSLCVVSMADLYARK